MKRKEARAQSNTRKRGAVKRKNKAARKKKREQRQHQGLRERAHERKEELQQKANEETQVRGRPVRRGDIFKIVGLAAFVGIVSLVSWLVWPYIHMMFEPGGIDQVIDSVRNAGPMGFLILLALQFLQIVVAFIPGEATQMAAGMLYGPWIGGLVILLGSILSSAFVFMVVHRLGAPFVKDMVSEKWMDKFDRFEKSGKLELVVFVLFLIPGMPKDIFTYLVPLTDMRMPHVPAAVQHRPHPGHPGVHVRGKRPGRWKRAAEHRHTCGAGRGRGGVRDLPRAADERGREVGEEKVRETLWIR